MGCGVEGGEAAAVREGVERCFGGRGGLEGGVGELTVVVRGCVGVCGFRVEG